MPQVVTGLQGRLILYLVLALVVLLGAFGILSLQTVRRAQSQAFSQQLQLAHAVARGIERDFAHIGSDAHAYLSSLPSSGDAAQTLSSLHDHLASKESVRYFRVNSVRLVDAGKNVLAAVPSDSPTLPETLPAGDIIPQAISGHAVAIGSSRLIVDKGAPFASVVIPLSFPGSSEGVALVVDTVGIATIDLFSSANEGIGGDGSETSEGNGPYSVEVLDPTGTVLTTSMGERILGAASYHYAVMRKYIARGEEGAIVHRPGKGRPDHIVAAVPLAGTPFFLLAEEPGGLLLDWPQQLRSQAIFLGGIAAVLILVVGWVVGRQIVQPLRALRRATVRIKDGDLKTPVQVKAQGEVAQLVAEVDAMRDRLQDTVSRLDGLTRSLTDQVEERTRRLHTVLLRLMNAQEEERRRVARDLHDETAQGLSALGILLDEAALNAEAEGKNALENIRGARKQVNRLVEETRRLAYALRPSVLDDAGLVPALRWCAEAYLETSGVQTSFNVSRPELRLPEAVEVALFRVGQEAMNNIARHAHAVHAWITIEHQGEMATLTVRDDGIGFNGGPVTEHTGSAWGRGLGLAGMQERIGLLGGRMNISSVPGQGTTVTAHVPTGPME
ncbi:MAG: HAMP domain-containing protein [Chloroflexi bacterium]|nr:HAMP domain-containing protein [Chloroflexota bacterium]